MTVVKPQKGLGKYQLCQGLDSHWTFNLEGWVQSQASSYGIYGKQNVSGMGRTLSTSVFPIITIPPTLRVHHFIYHWRYMSGICIVK